MIIHKEYWDSTGRIYPWLLFNKKYSVGVGSDSFRVDDIGIAPNSLCGEVNPQITIPASSNYTYALNQVINITTGWDIDILPSGALYYNSFWVLYYDTAQQTNSVLFRVYNYTNNVVMQQNSTTLFIYNFTYHVSNHTNPALYKWCITIDHQYWDTNQTICSVIYPYGYANHGPINGSWINWFLNHTLGPSPFKNVDTGQEVPWVYVFIAFLAFFILMSFDAEHINVGVMGSGMWLMFSGFIFNHLQTIGALGAVGIVTVGLFMILMGLFAEYGGFR